MEKIELACPSCGARAVALLKVTRDNGKPFAVAFNGEYYNCAGGCEPDPHEIEHAGEVALGIG